MRGALLLSALLWQAAAANEPPAAQPEAMRYERAVRVAAGAGQACAVLDAAIFAHAAPSLNDVRIFPKQEAAAGEAVSEVPYAITLSEAVSQETETARVLNLRAGTGSGAGKGGATIVFDLEMPQRAYTDVILNLDPAVHDFVATAAVTGANELGGRPTALGTFTLFDLASEHLSRDTTLPLQESTYRYLHVELTISPAPGAAVGSATRFVPAMVRGATVPPSREAQSVYTTVASVSVPTTGALASFHRTRFDLDLPLRVPVERVSFDLAPVYTGNFSRDVTLHARSNPDATISAESLPVESVTGTIFRVHSTQEGRTINRQELSVPAVLGANLQHAARVWIEVENGDDQPLPIAAVRLEMRQRKICFEAPATPSANFGGTHGADAGSGLALFYGDAELAAPEYDYARMFVASRAALAAELGPEELNPNYRAPAAEVKPFAERHPELLWIALIAAICSLGIVALKAARNVGR
jgi:hypothetical protein